MRINCDIGERGPDHAVDRSVKIFRTLAEENSVQLAAHLSYPDRPNFGRQAIMISEPALLASLDEQLSLLPDVRRVKFHGALYNESCRNPELAELLCQWLGQAGIQEILAPADAEITFSASRRGITVLREVFAERRYEYNKTDQRLYLIKRSQIQASITDLGEALKHAEEIIMHQRVNITHPNSRQAEWKPLSADTICIHSDSVIALDLALKLRRLIES
jgi:UPF0271 protein